MFTRRNIHKHTWSPLNEETHKQTDHVVIYEGQHSNIFDFRYLRGSEYDTDHDVVVMKVRKRLSVSK
jgi:hypothetical protein